MVYKMFDDKSKKVSKLWWAFFILSTILALVILLGTPMITYNCVGTFLVVDNDSNLLGLKKGRYWLVPLVEPENVYHPAIQTPALRDMRFIIDDIMGELNEK